MHFLHKKNTQPNKPLLLIHFRSKTNPLASRINIFFEWPRILNQFYILLLILVKKNGILEFLLTLILFMKEAVII